MIKGAFSNFSTIKNPITQDVCELYFRYGEYHFRFFKQGGINPYKVIDSVSVIKGKELIDAFLGINYID